MKTKFGVSVALVGMLAYAMAFFGGYIPAILLAGYVLLNEDNEWLRKTVIKAVLLMAVFAIAGAILGLIPDMLNIIESVIRIFDKTYFIEAGFIEKIVSLAGSLLSLLKKVLYLLLMFKALNQGNIKVGAVDNMIDNHTK